MAALSVQYFFGAMMARHPFGTVEENRSRRAELQATPPASKTVFAW